MPTLLQIVMIINYYELNLLLLITFNVHQTPLNRSNLWEMLEIRGVVEAATRL